MERIGSQPLRGAIFLVIPCLIEEWPGPVLLGVPEDLVYQKQRDYATESGEMMGEESS